MRDVTCRKGSVAWVLAFLLLGLGPQAATATAPDPGGNESQNVPVPEPSGKKFGFNTQRFESVVSATFLAPDKEVSLERQLGAQVQRFGVMWKWLQMQPGQPPLGLDGDKPIGQVNPTLNANLSKYDAIYAELLSNNMTPIMTLLSAPAWYTDYPGITDDSMIPPSLSNLTEWKGFISALATRYPLSVIEPWNEPNEPSFWHPGRPDAAYMAQLQCAAYQAVSTLPSPNAVIAPGVNVNIGGADSLSWYLNYAPIMYQNGLKDCMDALSIHTYPNNQLSLGTDSLFAQEWQAVRALRMQYADSSPIWITETGSTSILNGLNTFSESNQCSLNKRLYNKVMTMPDNIQMALFHTLTDASRVATSNAEDNFGFFHGKSGNTVPAKMVGLEFQAKATGGVQPC